MKKMMALGAAVLALTLTAVLAGDEPKEAKEKKVTIEGYIGDSMCGLDHSDMMK